MGPIRALVLLAAALALAASAGAEIMPPPPESGQSVAGFQDTFDGAGLGAGWSIFGQNLYSVSDGMLHVAAPPVAGDPNRLLYLVGGYSNSVQEVLLRIRVTDFGIGDYPRGGAVAVCNAANGEGIALNFREKAVSGGRSIQFLSDHVAWGTNTPYAWANNTWYWMRLRHQVNSSGNLDAFAKLWPSDGATPEPTSWITWDYAASRVGYAGIAASSRSAGESGLAAFDVDYFLLKAEGLPAITVVPEPASLTLLGLALAGLLARRQRLLVPKGR